MRSSRLIAVRILLGLGATLALGTPAFANSSGAVEGSLDGLGKGPFVVYVDRVEGQTFAPQKPVLGQKNNTYIPHILPTLVGSKLELRSTDPELHNIYAWSQALNKVAFNLA